MSGTISNQSTLTLDGTKDGIISIAKISEPYGEESGTVVSIGISLAGNTDSPEWKVHIPMKNLHDVISALESIK